MDPKRAEAERLAGRAAKVGTTASVVSLLMLATGLGIVSDLVRKSVPPPEPPPARQEQFVAGKMVSKRTDGTRYFITLTESAVFLNGPQRAQREFRVSKAQFDAARADQVVLVSLGTTAVERVPLPAPVPPPSVVEKLSAALFLSLGLVTPFLVLAAYGALRACAERKREEARPDAAPAAASPRSDTGPVLSPEEVAAAFHGTAPPGAPSAAYRVGMALAAGVLVLLVMIYVGLIAGVVWVMGWFALDGMSVLQTAMPAVMRAVLYAAPIGTGAILVLFMIKPLVAPRAGWKRARLVDRREQPAFVAFVERMAASVGAPVPTRIELDCAANASASFTGSWQIFRRRADVQVRIGLPFVAGLSAQELGHVVAHELSHCAQRAGLRVSLLIRAISMWFSRVLYERDAWDETLAGANAAGVGKPLLWLAWPFIRLVRLVLWCLGWTGWAVSQGFSRQLEYDADRGAVEACGRAAFESAQRRALLIDFASGLARQELASSWDRRRLADDLPRLIAGTVARLPEREADEAVREIRAGKAKLFDSHPSPGERLDAARGVPERGVFRLDGPAAALLRDFRGLSERATEELYRELVGEEFSPRFLVSTETFLAEQVRLTDDGRALHRIAGGVYALHPPVRFVPAPEAAAEPAEATVARLRQARSQMESLAASAREAVRRQVDAVEGLERLENARELFGLGAPLRAEDYGLARADMPALRERRSELTEQEDAAGGELGVYLSWLAVRLDAVARLLGSADVRASVNDAEARAAEAARLMAVVNALGQAWDDLVAVRRAHAQAVRFIRLLQALPAEHPQVPGMVDRLKRVCRDARLSLAKAGGRLTPAAYPFEHGSGTLNLAQHVIGELPGENNIIGLVAKAEDVLTRAPRVYYQMLGRLAATCERVETAVGLPLSPEPPKEPEPDAPAKA